MKIKQLLVLGCVLLTSITATAAVVDGVRQKPEPVTSPWTVSSAEAPYYLYNTSAKLFFTQGNTWGTRGCVGPQASAIKIYFSKVSEEVEEGSETYHLNTYICIRNTNYSWKMACGEAGGTSVYTDQGSGWGRPEWKIIPTTGNGFRIQTSNPAETDESVETFMGRDDEVAQDFGNAYSGFTDDNLRFPVSVELTEGEGHHIDWALVAPADYEAIVSSLKLFEKAQELKTLLDDAKGREIDVAAEEAVYLEESSSIEALEAAIGTVQTKISNQLSGGASVDNPKDMTDLIQNPNFDNASNDGWKGTAPNMVGNGSHGAANVAEHYNKTFDTYQELGHMPKGVYMLENQGFLRGWWDDHLNHTNYTAFLYAIADKDTTQVAMANPFDALNEEPMAGDTDFGTTATEGTDNEDNPTYYVPNDPSAARLYFEKGYYKNKVFFAIAGDSVKLGVKKDVNRGSEWAVFDNFKLTYYGNEAAAYAYWMENLSKTDYKDVNVSEQYLNAYNAAFQAASDKAGAMAVVAAVDAAENTISANIKLWIELKAKYDDGIQKSVDYNYLESAEALSEYLLYTVEDLAGFQDEPGVKTGASDLSNEELQAMIDKTNELVAALNKEAKESMKPGTDVTEFMTNPDFENGKNGWTVVSNGGGNVQLGGNDANHCFEAWHSTNFDVYQEIKDLPVGVYEVSVNGYVRYKDGQDAITYAADAPTDVPIYVYMNDSRTNLVSWLSYPKPESFYREITGATFLSSDEDNAYPDNMIAASAAFAEGGYSQTAKCLVAEAGTVTRIGVKGTPEAMFWPIFDNFKLTYQGYDIDVVKPILEEKIAEYDNVKDEMTTKSAKASLTAAIEEAKSALESVLGKTMFDATAKLNKAITEVKDGATLCNALSEEANAFLQYAAESESALSQQGQQLAATILSDLEECKYDEADLKVQSLAIREMKLKMELPVDYTESSEEGKDLTAFIQSPNFSKMVNGEETNSIDGWEGSKASFGPSDQHSALAAEFYNTVFDMYQDLAGVGTVTLPKGNYRLEVNAFNRPTDDNPAYLYVVADKDTLLVKEVMRHSEGFNAAGGETGPGSVKEAVAMFNEGKYLNQLNFRFEGDTLRIGIMHPKTSGTDWVIMDNFKLFFHGDDYTGVETVINLGKPVQVQYFTLDGRQVSAARKGLVIRKTIMDNGAVIVRKMQK